MRDPIEDPLFFAYLCGKNKLGPTHRAWMLDLFMTPGNRALMAHRNAFKTTAIAVGIVWYLSLYPDTRVLVLRKEFSAAEATVYEIKQYFELPDIQAVFKRLYGVKQIQGERWGRNGLEISAKRSATREPSVEPIGVGGAITGRHYDLIVVDDVVTREDRISRAERENTKDFCRELRNIPAPGGKIIYTGTPWHPDDAWTLFPTPQVFPIGTVPEAMKTPDEISDLKRDLGLSLWAANYELRHVSNEARLFSEIKRAEPGGSGKMMAYFDPAFGGGDTCAFCAGFAYGGAFYIIFADAWRSDLSTTFDRLARLIEKAGRPQTWIESNGAQEAVRLEMQRRGFKVFGIVNTENKFYRIDRKVRANWHKIFFAPTVEAAFIDQLAEYSEPADFGKKPDYPVDAADALAGLVARLNTAKPEIREF